MSEQLLTVASVLERLAISRTTLWALETRGGFPPRIKLGRSVRFRASDVDRWIAAQAGETLPRATNASADGAEPAAAPPAA